MHKVFIDKGEKLEFIFHSTVVFFRVRFAMPLKYCYLIPAAQAVIYTVAFPVTYVLGAFVYKDIPAVFPYISDTGVYSLQRCIFTATLCSGSILMTICLYIRYRQIKEILQRDKTASPKLVKLNEASIYMCFLSLVGVFSVGCFQVNPFLIPHLTAALIGFLFGWIVIGIQTYFSFKLYPLNEAKVLNYVRLFLLIIITVSMCLVFLFGVLSFVFFKGEDLTQWTENSGGYQFHLISSISEWFLVYGMIYYIALHTIDFKSLVLNKPQIKIINA
ncbi:DNA damage-regulated autophagy modulator protein 2-like [Anthonomus grandis grandis]|uniref:DNA damage-regulated autophagy modulator protein 2-like n=1 Tax=Anthonomus grandis grandis TaxID=2921223 RepID=UPI0021655319|nr:DNA damage-regulated autophagy modulator protein 2-like [Anthonomus grandis grandis]